MMEVNPVEKAKRMGAVIRVDPTGMTIWRMRRDDEEQLS